jgi:hypothetical protein
MNLEGVTLKLLLEEPDKERALEVFSELRQDYFSSSFASILSCIRQFYEEYSTMPSLGELKTFKNRDMRLQTAISTIEVLEATNIDIKFALDELANQYAQNTALDLIDSALDKLPISDRYEILEHIAAIPQTLEDKIDQANLVYSARDIKVFQKPEDYALEQILTGISDQWDHQIGGYFKQDLVLMGGRRGSGKSIVCANLVARQHEMNKPSMYFTIEMTARETFLRIIAILADVPAAKLKKGLLEPADIAKACKAMANFYIGGYDLYKKYFEGNDSPDVFEFQDELYKLPENQENRIIIIDDRELSTATIDTKIGSYKSKFGEELGLVVVDYLNQVVLEGTKDMYDWKDQIVVSKNMKNIARKHNICLVSPYQIDDTGQARFARGILDAPDTAQILKAEESSIIFETTKMRGDTDKLIHAVSINWPTLRIDPREVDLDEIAKEQEEEQDNAPGDELGLSL